VLRAWEIFELEIEQHNSDRQTAQNAFWLCALRTVGCRFAMDRLPAIPARTTISPWVATDIRARADCWWDEGRPADSARNMSTAASWDRVLTQTFSRSQARQSVAVKVAWQVSQVRAGEEGVECLNRRGVTDRCLSRRRRAPGSAASRPSIRSTLRVAAAAWTGFARCYVAVADGGETVRLPSARRGRVTPSATLRMLLPAEGHAQTGAPVLDTG